MPYSDNLLTNGSASSGDLLGWVSAGVTIVAGGTDDSYCFQLTSPALMSQNISVIDFIVQPEEFKIQVDFKLNPSIDDLFNGLNALVNLTIGYFDGSADKYAIPFTEGFVTPIITAQGNFYRLEAICPISVNSVLISASFAIAIKNSASVLQVDAISVVRSVTETENHNNNPNPHNLPLAITVDQNGIKGMKGDQVTFWLQDTGDAIFAGHLEAATGTFSGDVDFSPGSANETGITSIVNGVVTTDYVNALEITAGKVHAEDIDTTNAKIAVGQIEQLIVGANVVLGPDATIGWAQVLNPPSIPDSPEDIGALPIASPKLTNITATGIYTGTITASQINTSGLSAEKIHMPGYPNNYAKIGGTYSDLILYYNSLEYFKIYNDITQVGFYFESTPFLFSGGAETYPRGHWDFSFASITLPSSVTAVAVFG
jgi:hypothetical protein